MSKNTPWGYFHIFAPNNLLVSNRWRKVHRVLFICVGIIIVIMIPLFIFVNEVFGYAILSLICCVGFGNGAVLICSLESSCTECVCGTVISMDMQNRPTVGFTIKGEHYVVQYHMNTPEYKIGDEFWLKYCPKDPHIIIQEDQRFKIMLSFFCVASVVAFLMFAGLSIGGLIGMLV